MVINMNPQLHKLLFFAYGRGIITATQLRELLSMDNELQLDINGGIEFGDIWSTDK